MKVLIVAKTRRGRGACIGGISDQGKSVRLEAADARYDESSGMEYQVGQMWDVQSHPATEVIPPHVENIIVREKRLLPRTVNPVNAINRYMPPGKGGREVLFDGLTQNTKAGALYIAEPSGTPPYSTAFWIPDRPLRREDDGKRIRYRYPTDDGGFTLTFVGFQEPAECIEQGSILRVSLAHWWRPEDMQDGEYRCYVQLSGWFEPEIDGKPEMTSTQHSVVRPVTLDSPPLPNLGSARDLLKDIFGYDDFWPHQAEIIKNLLQKRDTLAIMPTGGGKSLCYQLPALMFDGLTVVVSPLISLMQDQVSQLHEWNIPSCFLNSTLGYAEYVRTTQRIRQGDIKLLYLAPETLMRPETMVLLDQCRIDCLTIDEAHCISSWGHDFRPEYRQMVTIRQRFLHAACFALTATATPRVQKDIKEQLAIADADEFVASFDRKNLFLEVQPKEDVRSQLLDFLNDRRDQSGIIYCATRSTVDQLSAELKASGWSVLPYHAGLGEATRRQNQILFSQDDVQIMVATVAFGMGIDKANVRFVVHYDLPKDIESYYQEIGRAGRDGLRADCLLYYGYGDVATIKHFIQQGEPSQHRQAYVRLQALVDYATVRKCRRRPLLHYFGQTYQNDSCGMCDNCLDIKPVTIEKQGIDAEQDLVDITLEAQKYLSCVKRTGELFGLSHIGNVLCGSKARSVLSHRHDQLSTYGIGKEYTRKQWTNVGRQLLKQGYLIRDPKFGGIRLTENASAVFRGEKVFGIRPERKSMRVRAQKIDLDYDQELFELLRAERKKLADQAHVPAFVIFSDRTLIEMATHYPQSQEEFLAINGVGRVKLQKYAEDFLPLIRTYCAERELIRPSEG